MCVCACVRVCVFVCILVYRGICTVRTHIIDIVSDIRYAAYTLACKHTCIHDHAMHAYIHNYCIQRLHTYLLYTPT